MDAKENAQKLELIILELRQLNNLSIEPDILCRKKCMDKREKKTQLALDKKSIQSIM
jgi:hypothetical protein